MTLKKLLTFYFINAALILTIVVFKLSFIYASILIVSCLLVSHKLINVGRRETEIIVMWVLTCFMAIGFVSGLCYLFPTLLVKHSPSVIFLSVACSSISIYFFGNTVFLKKFWDYRKRKYTDADIIMVSKSFRIFMYFLYMLTIIVCNTVFQKYSLPILQAFALFTLIDKFGDILKS